MSWRLAKSLETLRNEVNTAWPNRSKASDGTIGDAAHAASASDHNPNPNGVVCAFDITHDPKNGLDAHQLAERLRTNRHPNLRYIISNARIAGWWNNWQWEPSVGHTQHVHISVGNHGVGDGQTTSNYDSTKEWNVKGVTMPTEKDVRDYFLYWEKRQPTAAEIKDYTGRTWRYLTDKLLGAQKRRYEKQLTEVAATSFETVTETLYRKK